MEFDDSTAQSGLEAALGFVRGLDRASDLLPPTVVTLTPDGAACVGPPLPSSAIRSRRGGRAV